MNKSDLVDRIARDTDLSRSKAEAALDAALKNLKRSLEGGEKINLPGFGTFTTARRSARTGRNPQTGQQIRIPAKSVVKFSPGKRLKRGVDSPSNTFTKALLNLSRYY